MIYGNYKSQVRPYTKHLAHNRYYGTEQSEAKPPAISYVVVSRNDEILFESKYRGECNQFAMQRLEDELTIKAVRAYGN